MQLLRLLSIVGLILVLSSCKSDSSDGSEPPIVEEGDFDVIYVTVKLEGMPELFATTDTVNSNKTELKIYFDINEDNVISKGDLTIDLRPILFTTNGDYRLEANLTRVYLQDDIDEILEKGLQFEVADNEITFIVGKAWSEQLEYFSSNTQLSAQIFYWDENDVQSSDYLPAYRRFTQVNNNLIIKDDLRDYEGNASIIDIQEIRIDYL
ncbi:hypothetical protein [Pleionea sediminis]|uniref:hypothetical protein n=1 Tax=Pleionea sediminis TaxID=2569479 RepID=UPI001185E976|nr:hypothetical protein [Pleionea sediminis]